jgi:hypothetical protein
MALTFEHITQQGNGWRNDCGPAVVLMWLRAIGLAKNVTVLQLAKQVDAPQNGTDSADLVRAFAAYGVKAGIGESAEYPRIEIIDYGKLPREFKAPSEEAGTFLHWILRDSATSYFDPLHLSATRGHVFMNAATIDAAHASGLARAKAGGYDCRHVRVGAEVTQQPTEVEPVIQASGRATVRWKSWNVRKTPDVDSKSSAPSGEVIGQLENAQQFTVLRELAVGGVTFAELDLKVGGTDLRISGKTNTPARAFVLKQGNGWSYIDALPDPKPIPSGVIGVHPALPALPFHKRLGVHMLTTGKPPLQEWLDAGCLSFTCMDNVAAAREARAAGAAVIYRRYIERGVPDPTEFVRYMGLDVVDAVMVMGINEADNLSTSDLVPRFNWDRKFAEAVWARYPKCFPLIGSFSMGTPQIENPDVARVWRDTYGKFLNENWHRVGLNYHSYSGRPDVSFPPPQAGVVTPEWLEMRHLKYSYDPKLGALDKRVILVGDETGVDQQGTGGFAACGYDDQTFMRWWLMRRQLFEPHPQQYTFNLFQVNPDNARWAGYEVRRFRDLLKAQVWAG